MRPVGARAVALDAAAVALVSAAVLVAADRPAVMWAVLAAALLGRFAVFRRVHTGGSIAAELLFFALCAAVGALNDLNTVALHGVYRYTAPSELPSISPIPLWMLVFWGLIVRFVVTLTRWRALGAGEIAPRRVLGVPSTARGVALIAALLVPTRLVLFARYEDPLWSWLPFAIALAVFALAGGIDRHDLRLAAIALAVGPIVEALFIGVGGLHAYELGWLFGVPVWIVLWWALATLFVKDLGPLAYAAIERALAGRAPRSTPAGAVRARRSLEGSARADGISLKGADDR